MKYKMSARGGSAYGGKKIKLLLIALLIFPLLSSAQEKPKAAGNVQSAPISSPVNCFDYYKFQSVQVSVGAPKDEYAPGEKVVFSGNLVNQNDYPVVDGYVFVRIGKYNDNYTREGHFTVDEFFALEKVVLDAKESQKTQFSWTVPQNMAGGKYRADFFFSAGKKFSLGGLSFTNEIVVGSDDFNVKSTTTASVFFDKSATKVNGEAYKHIGNWPSIAPGTQVEIIQPVKNTFAATKNVKLTYDLYFWDSMREEQKITSKTEEMTVPAKGTADAKYTISQMNDSVYYLKITASADSQKTIVGLRFVSDQNHPRLNYPAITNFPLAKGEAETIFSCFHNTSSKSAAGKVVVILKDKKGSEIGKMEYSGQIGGAMMADKADFVSAANYDWMELSASLYDSSGKAVDNYQAVYDCAKLNSKKCWAVTAAASQENVKKEEGKKSNAVKSLAVLMALLIAAISILYIVRRKKGSLVIFLALTAAMGFLVSSSNRAEAYNERSTTVGTDYSYSYRIGSPTYSPWSDKCDFHIDGYASILHVVGMTSGNTTVDPGDAITFYYDPAEPFFNSTGEGWDTPYGAWCPNLTDSAPCGGEWMELWRPIITPSAYCNEPCWYDSEAGSWYMWDGETRVICPSSYCLDINVRNTATALKPTTVNMTSSDPAVVNCAGPGLVCTAGQPGIATLTAHIPEVHGKGWGRKGTDFNDEPCNVIRSWPMTYPSPDSDLSWDITVEANSPPTPPDCVDNGAGSCPVALAINQNGSFIFRSTDPNHDAIYYQVDWDGDEYPLFETSPSYPFPNYDYSTSHLWADDDNYTYKARACDNQGTNHCSGWSVFSVDVASNQVTLTVSISGSGNVTSNPSGINCQSGSGACSASFVRNSSVNLTASPIPGLTEFTGWGGACSGTALSCSLTMNTNKTVTANFHNMVCTPQCGDTGARCIGESWWDGCPPDNPNDNLNCHGTKPCEDRGWREVAP